jgi:hypothetical protein
LPSLRQRLVGQWLAAGIGAGQLGDATLHGKALYRLGLVAYDRSDYDTAQARYEEAQPLYEQAGSLFARPGAS